jgi:ATP-binding cassette subfamily F protein 2
LSIGRYHQHSTDALDNNMTPLEFFAFTYPNTPTFKRETDEWRAYLGRCDPVLCYGEVFALMSEDSK